MGLFVFFLVVISVLALQEKKVERKDFPVYPTNNKPVGEKIEGVVEEEDSFSYKYHIFEGDRVMVDPGEFINVDKVFFDPLLKSSVRATAIIQCLRKDEFTVLEGGILSCKIIGDEVEVDTSALSPEPEDKIYFWQIEIREKEELVYISLFLSNQTKNIVYPIGDLSLNVN